VLNARYFKTGKGQYGEGDVFIGVTVPNVRKVAKEFLVLPMREVQKLLASTLHEVRLLGAILWTMQFVKGDDRTRRAIFDAYLASAARMNNWDLVDTSAPKIVGEWLVDRDRQALKRLAASSLLWERRIAIVATYAFIRRGDPSTTFAVADLVMSDREDLMHKATGWMLREVGKRCGRAALIEYLKPRCATMPRTMLRYAIEHFPAVERRRWLLGKV
jgi:3-methyladenine DNA glycosylase AlkD